MGRDKQIKEIIATKNLHKLINMFFTVEGTVQSGVRTETALWDFKSKFLYIHSTSLEWAEISKDILSFYNASGGLILFGVNDDFSNSCKNEGKHIDSKIFNDKIRKYLGDKIWIEYHVEQINGHDIGIAIVPEKALEIEKFKKNSPKKKGKYIFKKNGSAIRVNDSTRVLSLPEANQLMLDGDNFHIRKYSIDEPYYRILCQEYSRFVFRDEYCMKVIKGLEHTRAAVINIVGIGGVGKTALATWAVLESYKNSKFEFIVSITAKDRELNSSGISALKQELTTFEDLLDSIIDVLGISELKELSISEKEENVRDFIDGSNGLIFIDNLETVSDPRVIGFLNDMPDEVKAIVTSRKNVVKVAAYPIELGQMQDYETIYLINFLATNESNSYINELSETEKMKVAVACDYIPLAIKWSIERCKSAEELLSFADQLKCSGLGGDELLEFSFRRIFDSLNSSEKKVLRTLAIFPDLTIEALIKGTGLNSDRVFDSLENLEESTIIIKHFDKNINGNVFSLLPLSKSFVVKELLTAKEENEIRGKLTRWFEALDIEDVDERLIVREMRQGNKNPGDVLVEMAKKSLKRGDELTASKIFQNAIQRDPKNWRVYKEFGEYYRHYRNSKSETLKYYEMAINYSSNESNVDTAILHREYGYLLRDSGGVNATDVSLVHLQVAKELLPNDSMTAYILATVYDRKGYYNNVIEELEPLIDKSVKNKSDILNLLHKAYSRKNQLIDAIRIKNLIEKEGVS